MSTVSELILNSGPFNPVWIAGTMKDKIGKKVVLCTDIADIAEKIMSEPRINLVLRLSGMLLKGLVVVYSKKTQYMLNDCEDIITKIMQSFKTNAVNLPPSARSGDALTISFNRQNQSTEIAIGDLNKWIAERNPEDDFIVKQTLDFPTQSEASQVLTQFSDSSSSTASSQTLLSDVPLEPIPQLPIQTQEFEPLPLPPQWDTDNDDARPTFEDIDDGGNEAPILPNDNEPTETETETDADNDKEKTKQRVIDDEIDMPNIRGQQRRKARAAPVGQRTTSLPQNDELEELFDIARKEFAQPAQQETDLDNEFAMPPEDVRYADNLPASDSDIPEPPNFNDDVDDNQSKISLPTTPNEYFDISSRNRLSSGQSSAVKLISPFPNIQFAIEKTPIRSVEDSITNETISVLNKIRKGLKDKDSITFNQAFSGSSRHGAASAFYQLLVLRSTGYTINVEQNEPFGPINIFPGTSFPSA